MPVLPLEPDDPREVGLYRLTGRLGEGGQGVVYLGQTQDGQPVAVKVLKTTADAALARFAREMESAKRVAPFCTAAVLESSTTGRHPYVVSEFIDGPSLQQRVAERGPLRGGDLDRLMVNTASGLTAIHGAGIVHRDLKPANVLLGPDGPRVVDFGIARAVDAETHTQMVGTPAYFAPEWLRGEQPTPASDVFAWAGTMVFAATGRPPFGGGSNIPALMQRIATEPPDLSGLPQQLRGLLAECLDKDPARRPTARALLVRLADPSVDSGPPVPIAQGQIAQGPIGQGPIAHNPMAQGPMVGPPPGAAGPPTQPPWQGAPVHQQGTVVGGPQPKRGGRTAIFLAAALVVVAALAAGGWIVLSGNGKDKDPANDKRAQVNQSSDNNSSPKPADTGDAAAIPQSFNGTWKGTVKQPESLLGSGTDSDVTIVLTGGTANGKASYSKWGCDNTLKLTSATESTLEFSETVVKDRPDQAACQGGSLKLTLQGGKLQYESPGLAGTTTGSLNRG